MRESLGVIAAALLVYGLGFVAGGVAVRRDMNHHLREAVELSECQAALIDSLRREEFAAFMVEEWKRGDLVRWPDDIIVEEAVSFVLLDNPTIEQRVGRLERAVAQVRRHQLGRDGGGFSTGPADTLVSGGPFVIHPKENR